MLQAFIHIFLVKKKSSSVFQAGAFFSFSFFFSKCWYVTLEFSCVAGICIFCSYIKVPVSLCCMDMFLSLKFSCVLDICFSFSYSKVQIILFSMPMFILLVMQSNSFLYCRHLYLHLFCKLTGFPLFQAPVPLPSISDPHHHPGAHSHAVITLRWGLLRYGHGVTV